MSSTKSSKKNEAWEHLRRTATAPCHAFWLVWQKSISGCPTHIIRVSKHTVSGERRHNSSCVADRGRP